MIANSGQGQSLSEPLCFLLGRDRGGHWIVQETHGLYGGMFTSETAALHYAKFESANRNAIFKFVEEPIEWRCAFR